VDLLPLTREPIRTLRPRISREQAIEMLSGGIAGEVRSLTRGPLRVVADLHVPFGLYCATIRRGATHERAMLGIDLVEGALDLYRFDGPVVPDQIEQTWTRNHIPAALPPGAAEEAIRSRLQRVAYRRAGFLAGGEITVDVEPVDAIVHVPYWTGFFGRGDAASLVVIDAVRCAVEGPKVRRLISRWLTAGATIPDPSSTEQAAARL
jgi:hypothetical protein